MKIPSNNQWTQLNQGDIFGTLNETRNITVNQSGHVELTRKSFSHFTSATDADFGQTLAILYYGDAYTIVTDDEAFAFNASAGTFVEIASTPAVGSNGDALVFNNLLYVMGETQLNHWDGASWTTNVLSSALTSGNEHPMTIFDSNPTYKLAIADGNKVYTYDTSHNINSDVLTLSSQFKVTCMEYRNGYLYIGTQNISGGEARVFIWNGSGTNAQYEVPVGGEWVFSMTPYGSTVACVVDTGEIALINGSSKETLATYPIYFSPNTRWTDTSGRRVARRGMINVGDSIYINTDGNIVGDSISGMKSGLWRYTPSTGLTHTAGFSMDEYVSDTTLSVTDSVITTSANHSLLSGDSVMFNTTSGLTGVDDGVVYYVEVTDVNKIKLALSRKSLEAGDYLTIGGTPVSLDDLWYTPNVDFGMLQNTTPGAVGRIVAANSLKTNWTSDILFSGSGDDVTGTNTYVLCGLTDSYNVGSLITQRIYSENISQIWKDIYTFIDGIDSTAEEIVIKQRTEKAQSKPTMTMRGNWGSTNAIHSDASQFDEDDWNLLEKGDEVYIVDGYGRGRSAHITKITETSNTFVVTLDETFGNIGSTVSFIADNWKKVGVVTKNRKERDYIKQSITPEGKGSWVQIKIELRGFGTKISHLELINSVDKSAV